MIRKIPYRALLLIAVAGSAVTYLTTRPNVLPQATFRITDGQRINTRDILGRPLIINFWSVSCSPCLEEMPALQDMYQKIRDKVTMIGVAMPDDRPDLVLEFSTDLGAQYPIALDLDASLATTFNIEAVPTTLLYDTDGNLIQKTVGIVDTRELLTQIGFLKSD